MRTESNREKASCTNDLDHTLWEAGSHGIRDRSLFEYGSIGKGVSRQPSYLEALLVGGNMGKFVRFGNVIVNTDQIVCIMDNGGKREIMLHHLSLVTDETFGDLLKILNEKEPSVQWIMNAGKGEQNE